jgi:hypothetical protein
MKMSAKDSLEIHKPQFDLPKGQLAHELTMLLLAKQLTGKEEPDEIYDRYLELLGSFGTRIDDQTRYENPGRKWMEAAPLGKSGFDDDESRL